jgi:haloalkane dehalogenase
MMQVKHGMAKFCQFVIPMLFVVSITTCKKSSNPEIVTPLPIGIEDTSGIVANDTILGQILRTPITRFANLPNYNFKANYINIGTSGPLQIHYIDEGPTNGKVILLMHGNPAWVYNFREIIPLLTAAGYRVIAPDLIGFGKSDKPATRNAHNYDRHTAWLTTFIEKMNLQNIHAHLQDWGGLIGLRVIIKNQSRFTKVAVSNTSLPDGSNNNSALMQWITQSQSVTTYGTVMERGTFTNLTPEEEAAYDAPFPDESFKAAPRQFPLNIPVTLTDAEGLENQQLWLQWQQWQKPFLTIFSDTDPISEGEQQNFITRIPGATGQAHKTIPNTNHFIREDAPQIMAQELIQFFQ